MVISPLQSVSTLPSSSMRPYCRSSSMASLAVFSSPQNAVSSRRISLFWSGVLSHRAA